MSQTMQPDAIRWDVNGVSLTLNLSDADAMERYENAFETLAQQEPSEAAADVEVFLKNLAKQFPLIPVTLEDERFTSVLAHRAMIEGGMKAKDRRNKNSVDRISAAIILQSYLDRINRK